MSPCLIEGPRAVHLEVGFADRRPCSDPIERRHERERSADEKIGASGDGEPDVLDGEADLPERTAHDGLHELGLLPIGVPPDARELGERDNGHVSHQRCSSYISYSASGSPFGSNQRMLSTVGASSASGTHTARTRWPIRTSSAATPRIR